MAARRRKALGIYYTPRFVVDFIVKQTLDPLLSRTNPTDAAHLRICDPACGDGAFLLSIFDYLHNRLGVEPRRILQDCIFGLDIDSVAVGAAREALARRAGKDVDLSANIRCADALKQHAHGKFDAIVGNPPYVRIQNLNFAAARSLAPNFSAATGKYDLYVLFVEQALRMLKDGGRAGFIVPNKFLTANYGKGLRSVLSSENALSGLIDLGEAQIFPEARTYTCLLFLKKSSKRFFWSEIDNGQNPSQFLDAHEPAAFFESSVLSEKPWTLAGGAEGRLLEKLLSGDFIKLGDVADRIFQGLVSGSDRLLYLPHEEACRLKVDQEILRPVLKGSDVRRYRIEPARHLALYPYETRLGRTRLIDEKHLRRDFPRAYRYLYSIKEALQGRGSTSMKYEAWYAYWCPRDLAAMQSPKILTQVLARGSKFAFDRDGSNFFVGGGNAGVYGILLKPDWLNRGLSYPLLLAVLNSRVGEFVIRKISSRFRGGYFSYARRFIERLPILPAEATDPRKLPIRRRILDLVARIEKSTEDALTKLDREIDRLTYELFDLTPAEIGIVERSVRRDVSAR